MLAVAAVSTELRANNNLQKFYSFCTISLILCATANFAQNSACSELQNCDIANHKYKLMHRPFPAFQLELLEFVYIAVSNTSQATNTFSPTWPSSLCEIPWFFPVFQVTTLLCALDITRLQIYCNLNAFVSRSLTTVVICQSIHTNCRRRKGFTSTAHVVKVLLQTTVVDC